MLEKTTFSSRPARCGPAASQGGDIALARMSSGDRAVLLDMGAVLTHMTMSLDGYIANPDDSPGELFDWYWAGDVPVASHQEGMGFSVDEASAEMLRGTAPGLGAP